MTVRFSLLAAGAICAAAASASAQSGFDDVVQAQVLQGWDLPDGRRVAALHLTLAPGWKTYWRAPGDAGIPPSFDWRRARNLGNVALSWPTPDVYVQYGLRSIGYTGELVIPMHVTPAKPGKPVRLRATMSLGVCADVCLPHEIQIDTVLDAPDSSPTPAIVAALADTPYSADEAGVRAATCALRPTENGMRIEARVTLPSTGRREVAVIEPGVPGVWVSEAVTQRSGDTLTAVSEMVHQSGSAFGVDRSNVRITILGGDYAVDVQGCSAG